MKRLIVSVAFSTFLFVAPLAQADPLEDLLGSVVSAIFEVPRCLLSAAGFVLNPNGAMLCCSPCTTYNGAPDGTGWHYCIILFDGPSGPGYWTNQGPCAIPGI